MHKKLLLFPLVFILTFLIIALFGPDKAQAEERSVFLYPYEDATIFSGTPAINYDDEGSLENAYVSANGYTKLSLLKFDIIPHLHSSAEIISAKLWVYLNYCEGTASPNEMRAGQVLQNWSESTITWNNKPSFIPGIPRAANCSGNAWWGFDVKNIIENWNEGQTNYGFIMYGPANGTWSRHFYSSEYGATALQPQLIVYYEIPEPPAEPEPDEPPANDPDESNDEDSSDDEGLPDDNDTGIQDPPDPADPSEDSILPENSNITAPSLLYVYKNSTGEIAEENEYREISVYTDEDITLVGLGKSGQKILLLIGDRTYTTTVNSLGYWALTIDMNDLGDGNFMVEAQAQENGKGSIKIFLFNLNSSVKIGNNDNYGSLGGLENMPIFSPIISTIGSTLFCLLLLCCCPISLIIFIIIIIKLLTGKKKPKQQPNQLQPTLPQKPAQPQPVQNNSTEQVSK